MPGKIGRPSSAVAETVVVQHVGTGDVIAWSDGQFAGGSAELKAQARPLYDTGAEVDLGDGNPIRIKSTSRGAAHAMLAACAGQGRILSTDYGVLPARAEGD